MRRLALMVNDVNVFTCSHHQCQTIILKRLESVKEFLHVFVKKKTQDFTGEPFWITCKTLCHQINKNYKKLFSKVLALRALFCHCQESGRKYSSTIFLPTSKHILTNIKTFKKQKQKKIRWDTLCAFIVP